MDPIVNVSVYVPEPVPQPPVMLTVEMDIDTASWLAGVLGELHFRPGHRSIYSQLSGALTENSVSLHPTNNAALDNGKQAFRYSATRAAAPRS